MWGSWRRESQGKYWFAIIPEHPNADSRGRVLEHRVVMENTLGRLLTPDEEVHHKNQQKRDNRPENLEVMTSTEHSTHHNSSLRKIVEGTCGWCGTPLTRTKRTARGTMMFCNRSHSASYYGQHSTHKRGRTAQAHPHGTEGRYRQNCHCDECKTAHATEMRAYRERKRNRT